MGGSNLISVLVGATLFVILVSAGWALFAGLRAQRAASGQETRGDSLGALLAAAPMQALLVRADGRLELSNRLSDWFGLRPPPRYLPDLATNDAGFLPEDLARLTDAIAAAQKAGRTFEFAVRMRGSSRKLMLRGARAPAAVEAPGGVLVWVFDATDGEAMRETLTAEAEEARDAFAALAGLIEAAPLPMWYRDTDLRLAMVNSAYVDAVEGQDASDVIGRGVELFEGDEGGALSGAVAAREADRPRSQAMPATIRGQRRMMRVVDVPLTVGGVAGFAIDIDELEQARTGQRRFVEAQRAMFDRLSAGVAQFGPDRSLVFANLPFQRLFAIRDEWLAERPEFDRVIERMRDAGRLPEVRDFPGWKAERREWFTAAAGEIEEAWHLAGGVHIRVVAQPLPDGGLLLVFEDRTEQVQLASARDTLLRVRTATFDNLFEALGVFAADGRLQLWNNRFRELWNFEETFLVAHPRVDALASAIGTKLANPRQASLVTELVHAATIERQQRGGRITLADGRHFEFAAVPLPDGNGLFTMLDVTDSRRIEQALRERTEALETADRTKTAFVATMSYELRTPLTSIAGFAEMLHGGYVGKLGEDAGQYVSAILDSTDRLSMLVDEVLEVTQTGGLVPVLDAATIDLTGPVRAAVAAVGPLAERRKLDFVVEVLPSLGRVRGDERRLQQVVEHLLRHSATSTEVGGRVLLHADGSASAARIIVSDDGAGLSSEAARHAFDPLATVGGEERMATLGLPFVRQLVEAHGGTVDLVSEPGGGTLVTVTLPRRRGK